jgi:ribosomal-protein-alanine N-acetyltransferase
MPRRRRTGPDPAERNTYRFSTPRLRVEVPEPADAPVLYGLVGGPDREEVTATLLWDGPEALAESESWIEHCRNDSFGDFGFHWVIRDRAGDLTGRAGRAMGAIGTRPRGEPGRADVGYWLGRRYWGQGIMTEALSALLHLGFDTLDYAKIEADVFVGNPRGIRLVESVGMTREGVVRRMHRKRGQWVDAAVYGILPGELPPR